MESERDQPEEETFCQQLLTKRQKELKKYGILSIEIPCKNATYYSQKTKLSATQSFLNMELKSKTPLENQNSDQPSFRSSLSNFSIKQNNNTQNQNEINIRNFAATPLGCTSNQQFFENPKRGKYSSISNSSPTSTLSAKSSRMKSTKSMHSLHSTSSTFARQNNRIRNQGKVSGRVNHPKGWGVRQSSWKSCDIANLMHMLEKAWEDKKTSGSIKHNYDKTANQQLLPVEKTPVAQSSSSSSFLKIQENLQQLQASPEYFDKERQQAQKISRKSSCHSSAKSDNHKRNRSDIIRQDPQQANKFITLSQNKLLLNSSSNNQYMTPKCSENISILKQEAPAQMRLINKSNKRGWQSQIIEALTQNPPQFFDSNRLSTFAKHKLQVAQNAMKENSNPFVHSRSTAQLRLGSLTKLQEDNNNKRSITPLSQQRSLKNLSINNFNCHGKYSSDISSQSPYLNSTSFVPQTCKHDLSLNFDFKLNQNNPQYVGKKMLHRPPSELKAISLYSDRKNQINLHSKSKSIQGAKQKRFRVAAEKNKRNNSSGGSGAFLNNNRFITTCGSSSTLQQDLQNSSLKLKKSKRYANVQSKVKKMIEETTSASVTKQRLTQVCVPVSITCSSIHIDQQSDILQNQRRCYQQNFENKSPIQGRYNSSEKRKSNYLPFKRHKRQTSLQDGGVQFIGKNLFNQSLHSGSNVRLFERHQSVPKLGIEASLQFTTQQSQSNITQLDDENQEIQNQQNLGASITPISDKSSIANPSIKAQSQNFYTIMDDNQSEQGEEDSYRADQRNIDREKKKLKRLNDQFRIIQNSLENDNRQKQNLQILTYYYTHKTGKCVGTQNRKITP